MDKDKNIIRNRIFGINPMCSLSCDEIKKCLGFQMVGERACDSSLVPGLENGKICKYVNEKFRKEFAMTY